jgi:hypothetical protein
MNKHIRLRFIKKELATVFFVRRIIQVIVTQNIWYSSGRVIYFRMKCGARTCIGLTTRPVRRYRGKLAFTFLYSSFGMLRVVVNEKGRIYVRGSVTCACSSQSGNCGNKIRSSDFANRGHCRLNALAIFFLKNFNQTKSDNIVIRKLARQTFYIMVFEDF